MSLSSLFDFSDKIYRSREGQIVRVLGPLENSNNWFAIDLLTEEVVWPSTRELLRGRRLTDMEVLAWASK